MTGNAAIDAELNSPFPERSIRTYEDWQRFASKPTATKPELPTADEYFGMSAEQRKTVNARRVHYNNSFGPATVPAMEEVHDAGIRLAALNLRAQPGARGGLIINGDSTIGKSTIAMQLGRKYEHKLTKEHTIMTTPTGHAFIPVAFINLPATMNIMNFNFLLATFYNIPFSRSTKEQFLTDSIRQQAADCCTSMVILDDIHFLKIKNRTHEDLNNHFKSLANAISATFVYAGIELEKTGLLSEGKSEKSRRNTQTGHRFKKFDLRAYSMKSDGDTQNFREIIKYFDDNIDLYKQVKGVLFDQFAEYILARTGGFIGPISQLLREASFLAIQKKKEVFSLELFQKIRLDHDSEDQYIQVKKVYAQKLKLGSMK